MLKMQKYKISICLVFLTQFFRLSASVDQASTQTRSSNQLIAHWLTYQYMQSHRVWRKDQLPAIYQPFFSPNIYRSGDQLQTSFANAADNEQSGDKLVTPVRGSALKN